MVEMELLVRPRPVRELILGEQRCKACSRRRIRRRGRRIGKRMRITL